MSNKCPILCLLLLLLACNESAWPEQSSAAQFIPSSQPPIAAKPGQKYQFGYLQVPENRSVKDSRNIRLPIYIFKSRSASPKKDPIIYLVGGPGYSVTHAVPYMNYYSYLDDRDFILFEQRGTSYAQPHLDCPEWSQAIYQSMWSNLGTESEDSLFHAAAQQCRDRLVSKGIDLNGYRTREIAADVADLARVLKLSSYNVLSYSYGTKIAQVLLRDHPEGLRSVVMDSPLPLEVNWEEESPQHLLKAYEQLFRDCEETEDCNAAFPQLKERFFDLIKNQTPLEFKVSHPQSKEAMTFKLQGKDLLQLLYPRTTGDIPLAPLRIDQLLKGNQSYVQQRLEKLLSSPGSGESLGMRISVWCAEETPFVDPKKTINKDVPAVGDWSMVEYDAKICSIWGLKAEGPRENQPVRSDIPTLLISGSYDPITPPLWAEQMQERLSASHHLIFEGWQHTPTTNWSNPCGMEVARQFFNQPGQKPALDCLGKIGDVQFQTSEKEP